MNRPGYLALALIVLLSVRASAQVNGPAGAGGSLADAAKKSQTSKTKAKKVFTDEDMSVRKNPIPLIALQGSENTDEILSVIREFRKSHTPVETEKVVHEWFDENDAIIATAAADNLQISQHNEYRREAQEEGYNNDPGDYTKARQRQETERRSQRVDNRRVRDNWQVIMRIQNGLQRVRTDMQMNRVPCDWFKIRQGNGMNSY